MLVRAAPCAGPATSSSYSSRSSSTSTSSSSRQPCHHAPLPRLARCLPPPSHVPTLIGPSSSSSISRISSRATASLCSQPSTSYSSRSSRRPPQHARPHTQQRSRRRGSSLVAAAGRGPGRPKNKTSSPGDEDADLSFEEDDGEGAPSEEFDDGTAEFAEPPVDGDFEDDLEDELDLEGEGTEDEELDTDTEGEAGAMGEGEGEGEEEAGYEIDGIPFEVEDISLRELNRRAEIRPLGRPALITSMPEPVPEPPQELVLPEGATMALNRQGYQAFQMGNIEFLVAETPDGKLDLQDSFVFDEGSEIYARPEVAGALPEQPVVLQAVPWIERKSGDLLKHKEPTARMLKVYFIGVQSLLPYRVAMDQVFKFEASSRVLSKETVHTVGTNIQDPILRIRADGLTIEDSGRIPTPSELLLHNQEDAKEETEEQRQERLKEMEEREELDKLDEQPDVPSADMM